MVSVKSWPSLSVPHIVVHTCIFMLCHLKDSLCHADVGLGENLLPRKLLQREQRKMSALLLSFCTAVVVLSICITPVWKYRMPCFSCMIGFVYFFVFFTVGPGEINSSCLMCLVFFSCTGLQHTNGSHVLCTLLINNMLRH